MMDLEALFSAAIGVTAPWRIVTLKFNSDNKRLDIDVDFERGSLFKYTDPMTGEVDTCKAYDTVAKTWRHLNFFEHECYINVRVPRVKPKFGGTRMVFPAFQGCVYGFTPHFEALILKLAKNMPVHQVGKLLNISDYKIWRVLECYVLHGISLNTHQDMTAVGMDETSLKKGHNYITLFVDLVKKKTMFVTEGKDHTTVQDFRVLLEDQGGKKENITDVSCDMSKAFIKGVSEQLPNAKITFDKFHILKLINAAVDEVRREEAKTNPILKKSRYVFLKNESSLTVKQRLKKEDFSKLKLKSMKALSIRETFQDIYQSETTEEFECLLKKWYFWATHSRLKLIVKVASIIKEHWDGILRWKESQINNGLLEGLNSIIQAAKRKARGYKIEHFKIMAYFLTGKLNLRAINPHLPTHF